MGVLQGNRTLVRLGTYEFMNNYSKHLKSIDLASDIPPGLRHTPVGKLLEYHNCGKLFEKYDKAQLLVCMCMDNRKQLRLPDNFAFILRTGGGNIRYSEFKISYAVAITYAPLFEIGNAIDFVLAEARRLNLKYPRVNVLPMFYRLSDGKLYLIKRHSGF